MESFRFKKKYGQNFLIDENIVRKIVDFPVESKSLVIEIGPGDGRLTKYLCEKFDKVLAYEIDKDLEDVLKLRLNKYDNYEIIFCDFLKANVLEDLKKEEFDKLYIVSNLPYYITTPIIEKIIELGLDVELIRIMVQKEVGDRFSATIGTKNYGSLTVYLNYNFDVRKEFIVSRNSFYPKPNVDSIVVSLYKKEKIKVLNVDAFYKLIRDSFQYKRKTLKNNLKGYNLVKIEEVLKHYNYDLSVRAEQLSVEIFCEIADNLQ